MTDADRRSFATTMQALCAAFNAEPSKPLLEAYWLGLADLDMSAMTRAVGQALRTCQRMPPIRDLRDLAGEMSPSVRAVRSWEAVKRAVHSVGSYNSVDFDDPLTNATVRNLGGWTRFCASEPEDFDKWLRKDFERVYVALAQHGLSQEQSARLPGIVENTSGMFTVSRVRVGLPAPTCAPLLPPNPSVEVIVASK